MRTFRSAVSGRPEGLHYIGMENAVRRTLPATDAAADIGRQLSRAATAVAANYRSSCRSRSDAEFAARIGVVLDEADESAFWLEIVTEDGLSKQPQAFQLLDEAKSADSYFRGIEHHRSSSFKSEINLNS